jgi:glycosyltransferase involved in cell wall biosynthesis
MASVSVIIPVYNGERFLKEAIESAMCQTEPPLEVIVVDDGSTDASPAVAAEAGATCISHGRNEGLSQTRNTGVQRAGGDLIAFLDADDVWLPNKLQLQVAALEASPGAGYALCHIRYFLAEGEERPAWFHQNSPTDDDYSCPPSTWLLRRQAWDAVGPFDPEFQFVEDIDWLARANDAGVAKVTVPDVLVLKRVRADAMTGNIEAIQKGMLAALRRSTLRKKSMRRPNGG